jgi:protoporphyrinogen/coproporphyrinogen III oxidase
LKVTLSTKKIAILGAGITGLATAFQLKRDGFEPIIIEKRSKPGGAIETDRERDFLVERGPNSALETTPLIGEIVEAVGLKEEIIYGSKTSNKRYILRNGKLHPLPSSPKSFITSNLFSIRAKGRLLLEPFIGKSEEGYYQSISEFVKRRLGEEFLDYAINPFVAGVYAGDPDKLSVKSAFPLLYNLEEKYGGLIMGTIKSIKERKKRKEKSKQSAKMISFKGGMQSLPIAIADYLDQSVIYQAEVTAVEKRTDGYKVIYRQGDQVDAISCDAVISTIPAYAAAPLFAAFDAKVAEHLNAVYYPPVLTLSLAYNKKDIKRELDGFGFLIPAKERKAFLGALWNSIIFEGRAGNGEALFTLFIGGARDPEIINYDREVVIKKVRKEFEEIMNIQGEPIFTTNKFWSRAIPQYNIGYIEHENYFELFENQNKGIILGGNYRGGISVSDCIKNSEKIAERVKILNNFKQES